MWSERILNLIDKINNASKIEKINKDNEVQNNLKKKILELNKNINNQLQLYKVSNDKCSFTYSDETKEILNAFVDAISEQLNINQFDTYKLRKIDQICQKFNNKISDDWAVFYKEYTHDTITFLNIFRGVKPDKINTILNEINSAKVWQHITFEKIIKLDNAMKESKYLNSSINSDEKITGFLRKINSGEATFSDIDQDIIDWIREENLSEKISVKFR